MVSQASRGSIASWKENRYRRKILSHCHRLQFFSCAENWGDLARLEEELQTFLRFVKTLHKIWGESRRFLVDLTFTDVMSSNITVYSKRNTRLTVGKKWTLNMKLCNLYYTIVTIWTYIICTWTNTLSH